MSKTSKPTDAEMEILQILWKNGSLTVKQVNEIQNKTREVGYTTSLKFMQIMNEKGLLVREKESRSHIYTAATEEKDTKNLLVDQLLDTAFGGSAAKLAMQALGGRKASREEIAEIRELLDNMEDE